MKTSPPITACLIDSNITRRQRISRSISKNGYRVLEFRNMEEFLNCDLPFSILILTKSTNGWNDFRTLCAVASVPVIVLAPEGQWALLSSAPELTMKHHPISVSHMEGDEIVWRMEALLLRTAQRFQSEEEVWQFGLQRISVPILRAGLRTQQHETSAPFKMESLRPFHEMVRHVRMPTSNGGSSLP